MKILEDYKVITQHVDGEPRNHICRPMKQAGRSFRAYCGAEFYYVYDFDADEFVVDPVQLARVCRSMRNAA